MVVLTTLPYMMHKCLQTLQAFVEFNDILTFSYSPSGRPS